MKGRIAFIIWCGLGCVGLAVAEPSGVQDEVAFERYPVSGETAEDAGMLDYLEPFHQKVAGLAGETLGIAAELLLRRKPENGIANFTADALRAAGEAEFGGSIDFALTNFGGLRRDLPAGAITRSLLMELSPFENYLTLLEIDGETALEIARATARSGAVGLSGMKVVADAGGSLVEATINGEAIEPERLYRVATIDYLLKTWEPLQTDPPLSFEISKVTQRDTMERRLKALAAKGLKLHDAGEGRVSILP